MFAAEGGKRFLREREGKAGRRKREKRYPGGMGGIRSAKKKAIARGQPGPDGA